MAKVILKFQGDNKSGTDPDIHMAVINNIKENYPELVFDGERDVTVCLNDGYDLTITVKAEAGEESLEGLKKLTHHAEGIWGDLLIENVHVELCIDGVWYGKPEGILKTEENSDFGYLAFYMEMTFEDGMVDVCSFEADVAGFKESAEEIFRRIRAIMEDGAELEREKKLKKSRFITKKEYIDTLNANGVMEMTEISIKGERPYIEVKRRDVKPFALCDEVWHKGEDGSLRAYTVSEVITRETDSGTDTEYVANHVCENGYTAVICFGTGEIGTRVFREKEECRKAARKQDLSE